MLNESAYVTGTTTIRIEPAETLFVNGIKYDIPLEMLTEQYFDVVPCDNSVYVNGVELKSTC